MNHSVKRRRQALHQTHHHYYLNICVEAANLSDWRIESNRNFFARIGMLYQTDNHASTPPLSFLQAGCPSCRPTNSVKALKAIFFPFDRNHCAHEPTNSRCYNCRINVGKQRYYTDGCVGLHCTDFNREFG